MSQERAPKGELHTPDEEELARADEEIEEAKVAARQSRHQRKVSEAEEDFPVEGEAWEDTPSQE